MHPRLDFRSNHACVPESQLVYDLEQLVEAAMAAGSCHSSTHGLGVCMLEALIGGSHSPSCQGSDGSVWLGLDEGAQGVCCH